MNPGIQGTTPRRPAMRPASMGHDVLARCLVALARLGGSSATDELPEALQPIVDVANELAAGDGALLQIGAGPLAQPLVEVETGADATPLRTINERLASAGKLGEPGTVWIRAGDRDGEIAMPARQVLAAAGLAAVLLLILRSASGHWAATFAVGYREEQSLADATLPAIGALIRHATDALEREHAMVELHTVNDSLRREVELAHNFFESAVVGMYLTDADGAFLRVNRAFADVFGYTAAELQGMHFTALLPEETREAGRRTQSARLAGDSSPSEWHVVRKDGARRIVCVHGASALTLARRPYVLGALHDVTDERRALDALRESEERFRALADSAPVPIWMTGARGELLFVNRSYTDFFGHSVDEVRGAGWQPLVHPDDRQAYATAFYAASGARQPFRAQARVRDARGDWRWVSSHALPRLSASGEFLGMVGISPDVTEVKLAQDELARANERLEQRVTERTERLRETIHDLETFSYSMAHDIRAPLRSMRGFAELLLEEHASELKDPAKEYLARIARSAGRLDLLTQDILSYSRLIHGEMKLTHVNVESLLRGILETYPNLNPSRGEVRIEPPLPLVSANAAALTQVLANLLDNSFKFVAPGVKPVVRVRAELLPCSATGAARQRIRIWIEDNGIGIDPRNQQRLVFGMFERLHPRDYEGTGMGLTIARKAIERMGGLIGVEPSRGGGSAFWFELAPG